MKKLLLTAFTLGTLSLAQAQIVIQSPSILTNGGTLVATRLQKASAQAAPRQSGTNQTWNWRTVQDSTLKDTTIIGAPAGQPFLNEFTGANTVATTFVNVNNTRQNFHYFWAHSSSQTKPLGYKVQFSQSQGPMTITSRMVSRNNSRDPFYRYPLNFRGPMSIAVSEVDSSFTTVMNGSTVLQESKSYTTRGGTTSFAPVGWGTLQLPTGDVPVLLFEKMITHTLNDFSWDAATSTWTSQGQSQVTKKSFHFFSTDAAFEVAEVEMKEGSTNPTEVRMAKYTRTGITSLAKTNMLTSLSAFPLPCRDVLNIQAPEDFSGTAVLYDSRGAELLKTSILNGQGNLSTLHLNAGMYHMVVKDKNGAPVASRQVPKF